MNCKLCGEPIEQAASMHGPVWVHSHGYVRECRITAYATPETDLAAAKAEIAALQARIAELEPAAVVCEWMRPGRTLYALSKCYTLTDMNEMEFAASTPTLAELAAKLKGAK